MEKADRKSANEAASLGGRVKGVAFRELLRWAESEFGHHVLERGYDRLGSADRALLDPKSPVMGVVATAWYPMRLPTTLSDAYLEGLEGAERQRKIREATRYSMDHTLKGVQRMIFQVMMTPGRAAKHMGKIWRLNYDPGRVEWNVIAPGHIEAGLYDWPGHTADFCLMLQEMETYFLELIGCTNVHSVRTACVGSGAPACTSRITWDA